MTNLSSLSALHRKYDDVIPKGDVEKTLSGSERDYLRDRAQATIYQFNQEAIKIIKMLDRFAENHPLPAPGQSLPGKTFEQMTLIDDLQYFLVQRCKWWIFLFHVQRSGTTSISGLFSRNLIFCVAE